ncbi:BT_3044 domain-containing protein [Mucilaginibacter phyllosphaerae]|nr:DUF4361 domain-containing protein [Mucilaginibacter phyllosphaerae]MBB3970064.1 hypothetical protein [Mucilaginibacter phyllosphaerae]
MKTNLFKYLAIGCVAVLLFNACRKDSYSGEQATGKGKSYIRVVEAPQRNLFFDAFTDIKTVSLFTLRKDAASSAELQKAQTITFKDLGQAYLDAEFGEGAYVNMPLNDLYTLGNDNIKKTSTGFTINFPAGSDVQNFTVKINGAKVIAPKYAIALAITDASGLTSKAQDTIVATVGIKNQYDASYTATGKFVRVGLDERAINQTKVLGTVDANTVSSTVADLGDATPLYLKINADNSVTVIWPAATQAALPGPFTQEGVNKYDPATKTFTLHYQYRGGARTTEEVLVRK